MAEQEWPFMLSNSKQAIKLKKRGSKEKVINWGKNGEIKHLSLDKYKTCHSWDKPPAPFPCISGFIRKTPPKKRKKKIPNKIRTGPQGEDAIRLQRM